MQRGAALVGPRSSLPGCAGAPSRHLRIQEDHGAFATQRVMQDDRGSKTVRELWKQLSLVRSVRFVARSANSAGWNGSGCGLVSVEHPDADVLLFHEAGVFETADGNTLRFRNLFRWWCIGPERLRLEHLRHGPQAPVTLFDLVADPDGTWVAATPHQCGADLYRAKLRLQGPDVLMRWTVTGPRKQETIDHHYSRQNYVGLT
jgi:hypothetical protein